MMLGQGEHLSLAIGGPAQHIPVLLADVMAGLAPKANGLYIDGTFGAGGYTRALLERGARVLAFDRDPHAIAAGQDIVAQAHGRLLLVKARFGDMLNIARQHGFDHVDGITLDIGVSSMQIDQAARGFSFRADGPLDMRMEHSGPSAADLVNDMDESALADIIYCYGEERASRRIARAICADRKKTRFETTLQLANLIARLLPAHGKDIHPATRTFQALRIKVNDELGELTRALKASEMLLAPQGRLAVVSFHSLEDRIVKQFLAQRSTRGRAVSRLLPGEVAPPPARFMLIGAQPQCASAAEARANPRARSAKLRVAERTNAAFVEQSGGDDDPLS
jgi:16S rRNA (cytosine1402-N4)-methyltransferase